MSVSAAIAAPMSSSAMPYQSVAQYAMLWFADIFLVRLPLTSPRLPSRPWPYIDMRAGLLADAGGRLHR